MRGRAGFTLVEIMIVVAIIALLAVLAVPSIMRERERSQSAKFVNALRVATNAIETYAIENHAYPPDTSRGVVPNGMLTYLDATINWTGRTPIGGQWDWDFNVFGITAAVSVVNPSATAQQLLEIDDSYDDGSLNSGRFQSLGPSALGTNARYSDIVER